MKMQRHLAPTAAPIALADFWRAILNLFQAEPFRVSLEAEIKRHFGIGHVFMLSSGKAALATIVEAYLVMSARRKVVIPAYTCYSVPSAVVRAGGEVVLCDVDPHTLDFDFDQLAQLVDGQTLCIVSPHLLGQAADIRRAQAIGKPFGVPVIEDAAQAMGRKTTEGWIGTLGDVGFFSLGRGKNVTAGSGGIIVTNSNDLGERIAKIYGTVPEESIVRAVINIGLVFAMKALIHPRAYWLPAGLPFLGLGETIYDPTFPIRRLDGLRAGLLKTWQRRLADSNVDRARQADVFLAKFCHEEAQLDPVRARGTAYLRLPVVMPTTAAKQNLCAVGTDLGLGVSSLYPTPVSDIPELQAQFQGRQYPGAVTLAHQLITLPVHHYVDTRDVERICHVLHDIVVNTQGSGIADYGPKKASGDEARAPGVLEQGA